MLYEKKEEIYDWIAPPFIGQAVDELGVNTTSPATTCAPYHSSKDINIVSIERGIDLAQAAAKHLGRGAHISIFARLGAMQVK